MHKVPTIRSVPCVGLGMGPSIAAIAADVLDLMEGLG